MIISDDSFAHFIPRNLTNFVVGLSGGADSLCVTLLMNDYAKHSGLRVSACIVDHKLRPESSTEILPIIDILKKRNIICKVFVWNHQSIQGNIEQKARQARYELLLNYCKACGADCLVTGHHALDQWETFFMRLSKGSGLKGLRAMQGVSVFHGVTLLRPLLRFSPAEIKETLEIRYGITDFVRDPMNECTEFERVRWRKKHKILSSFDLNLKNIGHTIDRLQSANECIETLARQTIDKIIHNNKFKIFEFAKYPLELRIRILDLLASPQQTRIISYNLLKTVANTIIKPNFTALNFAGLIFKRIKNNNILIILEKRNKKNS